MHRSSLYPSLAFAHQFSGNQRPIREDDCCCVVWSREQPSPRFAANLIDFKSADLLLFKAQEKESKMFGVIAQCAGGADAGGRTFFLGICHRLLFCLLVKMTLFHCTKGKRTSLRLFLIWRLMVPFAYPHLLFSFLFFSCRSSGQCDNFVVFFIGWVTHCDDKWSAGGN